MSIFEALTKRRKATEQTAESEYRELVRLEAGEKLQSDAKTVARIEGVLDGTARTIEDFQEDVARLREQHALEREVNKEPGLRRKLDKVRNEFATAEAQFDSLKTQWDRERGRLDAVIRTLQIEMSTVGKAHDRLRSEFPDSEGAKREQAVAKEIEQARAELQTA